MNPLTPLCLLKWSLKSAVVAMLLIVNQCHLQADEDGKKLSNQAAAAEEERDIDLAIELYSRAIKSGDLSTSQQAYMYYRRASLWAHYCENGRAIDDFTKAIELDPFYGSAYSLRGYLRGLSGQYELAEKDHTMAMKLVTESKWEDYLPWVLQHYADLWRRQGQFEKALETCSKAFEKSDYAAIIFRRAWIYLDMGELDKAKAEFKRFKRECERQNYSTDLLWPDEQIAFNRLSRISQSE